MREKRRQGSQGQGEREGAEVKKEKKREKREEGRNEENTWKDLKKLALFYHCLDQGIESIIIISPKRFRKVILFAPLGVY